MKRLEYINYHDITHISVSTVRPIEVLITQPKPEKVNFFGRVTQKATPSQYILQFWGISCQSSIEKLVEECATNERLLVTGDSKTGYKFFEKSIVSVTYGQGKYEKTIYNFFDTMEEAIEEAERIAVIPNLKPIFK